MQLFLIRGLVAIIWAALFAAVSDSLMADVTAAAGILVVIYPLIDVAASLIDARSQRGSARRLLLAGAAVSAVAAAALAVAATRTCLPSSVRGPCSAVRRSSSSPFAVVRSSAGSGRCSAPAPGPSALTSPTSSPRPARSDAQHARDLRCGRRNRLRRAGWLLARRRRLAAVPA